MGEETLTMSRKERHRLVVMNQVREGVIALREASQRLRLSYRQTKRLWSRFKKEGASGLIHGNRGLTSNRSLPRCLKQRVLGLYEKYYKEYGPTLASEVLAEEHGIQVHPETLRRWVHGACLYVSKRRHRQHRKRRERRRRFGQLVQIDGSHHAWFGERAGLACLMVAVDDATGRTMAHMAEQETTDAAYDLLNGWIKRYGVPEAIYVDRRSIYVADREPTADEHCQGSGPLANFGRACWRLGIEIILARSPEAKGRVERKNGVLQDRFVKYLQRWGMASIRQANKELPSFLQKLDAKQAREPVDPVDAHRKAPTRAQMVDICCREEERSVGRDWTVQYAGRFYQIEPQEGQPTPRQRVIVRTRRDRSLAILHQGRELAYRAVAR